MKQGEDGGHGARLYAAAAVREFERQAAAQLGLGSYALMRRAAQAAFDALRRQWPRAHRIAVLCGPGNNGGDGYELARLIAEAGLHVDVTQVGGAPVQGDAVIAHAAWVQKRGPVPAFDEDFAQHLLPRTELIVDALFGIGLSRPVEGLAAQAIAAINAHAPTQSVFALDIPSGLDADRGAVLGAAVRAHLTLSFVARKPGLYTGAGPACAGLREFDDLGLPAESLARLPAAAELLHTDDLHRMLPPRSRDAHKGRHGHVLLIGGNRGMAGALLLAVRGALRAGAGLVSVLTRTAHALPLTAAQPEAMFHGEDADIASLFARASVIAVGPGLGQDEWARMHLQAALRSGKPLVIDADALNILATQESQRLPANVVVTPHPGEAARLLGMSSAQVQADRLRAVHALRTRTGAVVVLKGAGTLVCGAQTAICPYGNPGMGVGGMGDVLTGVIAAFIAQGLSPEAAATSGALAHALAGDAAARSGERGLLPQDLIEALRAVVNPACT